MKRHEQERELADPIPLLDPPDGPNAESLEAIHEGDVFFATESPVDSTTQLILSMQS